LIQLEEDEKEEFCLVYAKELCMSNNRILGVFSDFIRALPHLIPQYFLHYYSDNYSDLLKERRGKRKVYFGFPGHNSSPHFIQYPQKRCITLLTKDLRDEMR
jgi:hypothetical protein